MSLEAYLGGGDHLWLSGCPTGENQKGDLPSGLSGFESSFRETRPFTETVGDETVKVKAEKVRRCMLRCTKQDNAIGRYARLLSRRHCYQQDVRMCNDARGA